MVRLGHHKLDAEVGTGRQYAQVTCEVSARLVYDVLDDSGQRVGGAGSEAEPWHATDLWVLERCLGGGGASADSAAWRLKARLGAEDDKK